MTEVLLVRPGGNEADAAALSAAGLVPVVDPYLEIVPAEPAVARNATEVLAGLAAGDWVAVTSARTLPVWRALDPQLPQELAAAHARGVRWAALGAVTAASLDLGEPPALIADGSGAAALANALTAAATPAAVLLPGSVAASPRLAATLTGAGWRVVRAALYAPRVVSAPPASAARLRRGDLGAVLLRSPSAVRAVTGHAPPGPGILALAVGATTAKAARRLGWTVAELPTGTPDSIADAAASALAGRPR